MRLVMPIGYEDFAEVRRDYYYVDKTGFLCDFLKAHAKVTLFTRPRRFGKTLMLSTLRYFLDVEHAEEHRALFEGLRVAGDAEAMAMQGTRPVLFLSLKDWKGATWEILQGRVQRQLSKLFQTYDFLFRMSITPSQWGKIYRTEQLRTFQNQVDSRISTGEDVVVIWPLLLHARRIVVSGKEFYHYCWRGDSIGGTFSEDDGRRVETFLAYLKQHFMEIRSKVPNIMMQYWLEEAYTWFMRDAERIVAIHEDELFPFGRVSKSARIVIYGAGRVGQQMKRFLDRHGYDVVAWVDQDTNKDGVLSPLALAGMSYDIVLISTVKASILHSIEQDLKKLGVPMGKIRKIEVQALLKGVEADG